MQETGQVDCLEELRKCFIGKIIFEWRLEGLERWIPSWSPWWTENIPEKTEDGFTGRSEGAGCACTPCYYSTARTHGRKRDGWGSVGRQKTDFKSPFTHHGLQIAPSHLQFVLCIARRKTKLRNTCILPTSCHMTITLAYAFQRETRPFSPFIYH